MKTGSFYLKEFKKVSNLLEVSPPRLSAQMSAVSPAGLTHHGQSWALSL
jgi:hypothetical protein